MRVLKIQIDIDDDIAIITPKPKVVTEKPVVVVPPPVHYTSFKCTACGGSYNKKTMKRHLETARHLNSLEVE